MSDSKTVRKSAPDDQLVLTFRILRCAIVAAALALGVSLLIEGVRVGSIRGSISAYFYSPVRSIFVGGLMAIGVCLIAIQAKKLWEETALNLAGLFAFVVALVPIRPEVCTFDLPAGSQTFDPNSELPKWINDALSSVATGSCRLPAEAGGVADGLPAWVATGIRNNVLSVIIVGALALGVLVLYRTRHHGEATHAATAGAWALAIYFALLLIGVFLYATFDGLQSTSHYLAAGTMFVMFGVVVVINARREGVPNHFKRQYWTIAGLMVAVLPLGALASIYWLEAAEIALFTWFWIAQTVQIWNPEKPGARAVLPT